MRQILNGVRAGAVKYLPGDEAALAEVATPEQILRLLDKGAIAGDWGQPKKEPEDEPRPTKRGK